MKAEAAVDVELSAVERANYDAALGTDDAAVARAGVLRGARMDVEVVPVDPDPCDRAQPWRPGCLVLRVPRGARLHDRVLSDRLEKLTSLGVVQPDVGDVVIPDLD